jgi:hypothetical protein
MHQQLTGAGLLVTRFGYPLAAASAEKIDDAIATGPSCSIDKIRVRAYG